MNAAGKDLAPVWSICTCCGLPLRQHKTMCPSCGTIAPVERVLHRIEIGGRRRLRCLAAQYRPFDLIIWALALTPLILPPIFALAISWRLAGRREIGGTNLLADPTWVSIAALVNLALSGVLIAGHGGDMLAIVEGIRHWTIPRFVTPEAAPKLTPI